MITPPWAARLVNAGGELYATGEHGQWTIIFRGEYVTDADCPPGYLAVGDVTGTAEDPAWSEAEIMPEEAAIGSVVGLVLAWGTIEAGRVRLDSDGRLWPIASGPRVATGDRVQVSYVESDQFVNVIKVERQEVAW